MRCPICESSDKWKNVDHFRVKPEGMSMCGGCGFISYPDKYKTKSEIIEFYKKDYRPAPNINNIHTGERKLHYHSDFLKDVFKEWKDSGREELVVTDIGSAFGMFLNWMKHIFPKGDYVGVELTQSFVRNAWHLYRIKTIDDFDDYKKYDLISSYKSLEHILDPDIELKRYINALKDDGYLYLSVPCWFNKMSSFGKAGFDLEYYYSPSHINTWTRKHFEGMLARCCGKIIKENHVMYESTYLVQKGEVGEPAYEDPSYIMECLDKIYKAHDFYQDGKYYEAIEVWPNFPIAHYAGYEHNRAKYHKNGFDWIHENVLKKALKDCPGDFDTHSFVADICMRYGQYERAIEYLNEANKICPNVPGTFLMIANCFRTIGDNAPDVEAKIKAFDEARKCATIVRNLGHQYQGEAMTWIMHDSANIPTPWE